MSVLVNPSLSTALMVFYEGTWILSGIDVCSTLPLF